MREIISNCILLDTEDDKEPKYYQIGQGISSVCEKHQLPLTLEYEPVSGRYDVSIRVTLLGLTTEQAKELVESIKRD